MYLIVVDGGGTGCRARLHAPSGEVIGAGEGGPANAATDLERTIRNVRAAIRAAYAKARRGHDKQAEDGALLGLAGAGLRNRAKQIEAQFGFGRIHVGTDRDIMVEGALGGGDGTVAMFGTGSFLVARREGDVQYIGGHGLQLGDEGGGAWLGREALRAAIRASEGMGPESVLTKALLAKYGGAGQLVSFAATARPQDYAHLAPVVVKAAGKSDDVARMIVHRAMEYLLQALLLLDARHNGPLVILGGLAGLYRSALPDDLAAICAEPQGTALDGAYSLARKVFYPGVEKR